MWTYHIYSVLSLCSSIALTYETCIRRQGSFIWFFLCDCAMAECYLIILMLYCHFAIPEPLFIRPASDARIPDGSSCVNVQWQDVTLSSLCCTVTLLCQSFYIWDLHQTPGFFSMILLVWVCNGWMLPYHPYAVLTPPWVGALELECTARALPCMRWACSYRKILDVDLLL